MNRDQWKAISRALRDQWKARTVKHVPADSASIPFMHNGQSWHLVRRLNAITGLPETLVESRIIRDRSPRARAAVELAWARNYRRDVSRKSYLGDLPKRGARACIADCRAMLASASAFHALP